MPPRMILFDLGNVLLTFDHRLSCRQMAEVAGVSEQQVWKIVFDEGLQRRFEGGELGGMDSESAESDPLYDEAVKIVTETRKASISGVQRRLRIGYNRAARMVEAMEMAGVVGPLEANGSREVLAPPPVKN